MQSKQWIARGESVLKNAKTIYSAGKVTSVFRDTKGIWLIGYLEEGETVTGQLYTTVLDILKAAIQEKTPGNG